MSYFTQQSNKIIKATQKQKLFQHWSLFIYFTCIAEHYFLYSNLILQTFNRESPRYLMEDSKTKKQGKKNTKKPIKKTERSFGMALDLDDQQLTTAPPPTSAIQEDDDDFIVCKGKTKANKQISEVGSAKQQKIQQKKNNTQSQYIKKQAEAQNKEISDQQPKEVEDTEIKIIEQPPAIAKQQTVAQTELEQQKVEVLIGSQQISQVMQEIQAAAKQIQKVKEQEMGMQADQLQNQEIKISKNESKKKTKKAGSPKKVAKKQPKLNMVRQPEETYAQQQIRIVQKQVQQPIKKSMQVQVSVPKQAIENDNKGEQEIQIEIQPQPIQPMTAEQPRQQTQPQTPQQPQQPVDVNIIEQLQNQQPQIQTQIQMIQEIENVQPQHIEQNKQQNEYNRQIPDTNPIVEEQPIPIPVQSQQQHQQPQQPEYKQQQASQIVEEDQQVSEQQSPTVINKPVNKKKPNKQKTKKPKTKTSTKPTNTFKLNTDQMDWEAGEFKNQDIRRQQPQSTVLNNSIQQQQRLQEQEQQKVEVASQPLQPTKQKEKQQQVPIQVEPIEHVSEHITTNTQLNQPPSQIINKQQQIHSPQQPTPKIQQFQPEEQLNFTESKISMTKNEKPKKVSKKTTKRTVNKPSSKIVADDLDDMIEAKQQKVMSPKLEQKIIEQAVQQQQKEMQEQITTIITKALIQNQSKEQLLQKQIPVQIKQQPVLIQQKEKQTEKEVAIVEKTEENTSMNIETNIAHQNIIENEQQKPQIKFSNPKKKKTTKAVKQTKTTKLKINKSQVEEEIMEQNVVQDVVIQPVPQEKTIHNQVPFFKQQEVPNTQPQQQIQAKQPQQPIQVQAQVINKEVESILPQIIKQDSRSEQKSITQSEPKQVPPQSEIKIENEGDKSKSEGIKITKNVVAKKNKKEKPPVKKLKLGMSEDFQANIQEVGIPQPVQKSKIPDKIEQKIQGTKEQKQNQAQIESQIRDDNKNILIEPTQIPENKQNENVSITHEVQPQKEIQNQEQENVLELNKTEQQGLENKSSIIQETEQKFEDFVDKKQEEPVPEAPPQKVHQQQILEDQNPKFTQKNKQVKAKSKTAKGKEKKKVEESKLKKTQKLSIQQDEQFQSQPTQPEVVPQPSISAPRKGQQTNSRQVNKDQIQLKTKQQKLLTNSSSPKNPLPSQNKQLNVRIENHIKIGKQGQGKLVESDQAPRKKLVDELVSIVTLCNKKHLNAMKERLLMMREDIRSSLYERQQKQKIKQTLDVHYDHIIAQNLQLKGRLES